MKRKVLVFRELPADQLARLTAVHEVTVANPRLPEQAAAFRAALPEAEGMIGSSYAINAALLEQAVGNKTLLGAVAVDLLSGNYEAALAALAADVGLNEVNCAVVAFSDLESALETAGTGSGVTPKATNVALTNADAYIAKHGLRAAAASK